MLIPSIDLMGGKIVQLVQGKKKALEFDDFEQWINRFAKYPLVQLIDLDAATGTGNNAALVRDIARLLRCQVGGGIRSLDAARATLALGARRVILGSSLIANGAIDVAFAQRIAAELGPEKLVFAVDSISGRVAIRGWQEKTKITALEMIRALQPCCAAFLYTHIDTEGLLQGFPIELAPGLRNATSNQMIVAGGIRSQQEVDQLDALGVDAVVGMAIYTGLMSA
ncbi:MAG TPA: HisA/HisF-related TIM barrel protein [Terriglobales bacterium]|jgi:phosphoribosylformimino-5-aminoimidazole carboxamide ribotide isomerase|nr:HisA/HisF-related TIM barrel protein [Terriglobales bacterium]